MIPSSTVVREYVPSDDVITAFAPSLLVTPGRGSCVLFAINTTPEDWAPMDRVSEVASESARLCGSLVIALI